MQVLFGWNELKVKVKVRVRVSIGLLVVFPQSRLCLLNS